jgi:hypothetical protein
MGIVAAHINGDVDTLMQGDNAHAQHAREIAILTLCCHHRWLPADVAEALSLMPSTPAATMAKWRHELTRRTFSFAGEVDGVVARLRELAPVRLDQNIRTADIIRIVAQITGVSEAILRGGTRPAPVTKARAIIYWAAPQYNNSSLPGVGRVMNKDHTTVLHGRNRVQRVFDAANRVPDADLFINVRWLWVTDWRETAA